jgi:hypothetical protein
MDKKYFRWNNRLETTGWNTSKIRGAFMAIMAVQTDKTALLSWFGPKPAGKILTDKKTPHVGRGRVRNNRVD